MASIRKFHVSSCSGSDCHWFACAINAIERIRCATTVLDGEPEHAARDPQNLIDRSRRVSLITHPGKSGPFHPITSALVSGGYRPLLAAGPGSTMRVARGRGGALLAPAPSGISAASRPASLPTNVGTRG
jgi:hypothetical protein